MGEGPELYASGFHHPTLSISAESEQGAPVIAVAYRLYRNTGQQKMQALFIFDAPVSGCYHKKEVIL